MIVVSGMARTGTSAMMQTLIHLGLETPAKPFLEQHTPIIDKNPKGFYELYDEVKNGVHDKSYQGMAVKLFGGCLWNTPTQFVSKMIVMKRNKADTLKSYEPIWEIMNDGYTPEYIYDINYRILSNYSKQVPTIFINFEELVVNPKEQILKVIDFLGIKPTEEQIDNSIKNIDVCHY